MPVTYAWLIPDRVMGLRWSGDVNAAELEILDAELVQILNASQQPLIHFISHELELKSEPAFTAYLRARCVRHQRFGWYYIIQKPQNYAARFIAQMAGNMLRVRLRLVDDEATAWAHLRRLYPDFEVQVLAEHL
jgi:hypothetical protein